MMPDGRQKSMSFARSSGMTGRSSSRSIHFALTEMSVIPAIFMGALVFIGE